MKAKTNLILTSFVILAIASLCGCATTAQRDLSALQGAWVGPEVGGPGGECHLTVSADTLKFQGARQGEWYAGKLTLIPNTSPRQAEVRIEDCPAPQYLQKVTKAIYQLEGKTLRIAGHEPGNETVPTGFEGDREARVFVFHRQ